MSLKLIRAVGHDAADSSRPVDEHLGSELHERAVSRSDSGLSTFGELYSCSPKMHRVFALLEAAAPTDASILLDGETGVGKEFAAECIHRASQRNEGPFVVFDCAAKSEIPAELELFGHEDVNDPSQAQAGVLEQANGGTVVLDHIDSLVNHLQARLLKTLERCAARRVGGAQLVPLNFRLISVTSQNMAFEVRSGNFRRDLYLQISAVKVQIPPLRARLEDLTILAGALLAQRRPKRALSDIPTGFWLTFAQHRWPGNVRELRNALERALI